MSPRTFKKDQPVKIKVQTLVSSEVTWSPTVHAVSGADAGACAKRSAARDLCGALRRRLEHVYRASSPDFDAVMHDPRIPTLTRGPPSQSQLQFDYYQLPFCKPKKIIDLPENLGEALAGEKAHTSAFKIRMRELSGGGLGLRASTVLRRCGRGA